MEPIICKNDGNIVLSKMKEYLTKNEMIKDICILEQNGEQIVFLLADHCISEETAKIWWNGYSAGMKAALE